jgi:predicted ArsR family transcriptional regulator
MQEPTPAEPTASAARGDRLAILKALGDNTRYAIYLELARSTGPLATADIADTLTLHPNTVRPHLERMREVGLLTVESDPRGSVGRPQHRYGLAADAPSLGFEPPSFPVLARMLLTLAGIAGVGPEEAVEAGREQGRADAAAWATSPCLAAVTGQLETLGFDPAVVDDDGAATVAFTHCPFRELAEQRPDLVCSLHRGMIEGLVGQLGGGRVERFGSLVDRTPCQVELSLEPRERAETVGVGAR